MSRNCRAPIAGPRRRNDYLKGIISLIICAVNMYGGTVSLAVRPSGLEDESAFAFAFVGAPACCARSCNARQDVGHLLPGNVILTFFAFHRPHKRAPQSRQLTK